eukprot:1502036-Prymnesium_polylepis.2
MGAAGHGRPETEGREWHAACTHAAARGERECVNAEAGKAGRDQQVAGRDTGRRRARHDHGDGRGTFHGTNQNRREQEAVSSSELRGGDARGDRRG